MDYTGNVSITTCHLRLPLILGFAVYMYGMCLAHGILQTVVRHHPFSSKATRTGPFHRFVSTIIEIMLYCYTARVMLLKT